MNHFLHVMHTLRALDDQPHRQSVPETWHEMHITGIRHVRFAADDMSDEAIDWRQAMWDCEEDR